MGKLNLFNIKKLNPEELKKLWAELQEMKNKGGNDLYFWKMYHEVEKSYIKKFGEIDIYLDKKTINMWKQAIICKFKQLFLPITHLWNIISNDKEYLNYILHDKLFPKDIYVLKALLHHPYLVYTPHKGSWDLRNYSFNYEVLRDIGQRMDILEQYDRITLSKSFNATRNKIDRWIEKECMYLPDAGVFALRLKAIYERYKAIEKEMLYIELNKNCTNVHDSKILRGRR